MTTDTRVTPIGSATRTLLATTLAAGLLCGSVAVAGADNRTRSQFYADCKANRGPGSAWECCIAAYGNPTTGNGGAFICTIPDSGSLEFPKDAPTSTKPVPPVRQAPGVPAIAQ